jgi:hypothetical protein
MQNPFAPSTFTSLQRKWGYSHLSDQNGNSEIDTNRSTLPVISIHGQSSPAIGAES